MISEAGEAPELASTLMNTASQIGIAGGAAVGGLIISQEWQYRQIALSTVIFYVGAVGIGLLLVVRDTRVKRSVA